MPDTRATRQLGHSTVLAFVATLGLLGSSSLCAQQGFRLSSKFQEAQFQGQTIWNGQHRFANVFCLTFPRSSTIQAHAEALYNNNTLYFTRASYRDMTAIYVVSSTVPAGRSVEVEIGNLAAQNQRSVDAYPKNFRSSRTTGLLGPSLVLTVRNALEGGNNAPFPFVRSIDPRPDAPLRSLSVHRLFVHAPDRIEVAGLRYFKDPLSAESEETAISDLAALVEQAAESLQSCTAQMPQRTR